MRKIVATLIIVLITQIFPNFASAAEYSEYPWFYYGFDEEQNIAAYNSTVTWTETEGVGTKPGALKVDVTATSGAPKFTVSFEQGVTYKFSAWVKTVGFVPNTANNMQYSRLTFLVYSRDKNNLSDMSKWNMIRVMPAAYVQDEWVYLETTWTPNGKNQSGTTELDLTNSQLQIRVGDQNGDIGNTTNGEKSSYSYYIDDIRIEPVLEYADSDDEINTDEPSLGDFNLTGNQFEGETLNIEYSNVEGDLSKGMIRVFEDFQENWVLRDIINISDCNGTYPYILSETHIGHVLKFEGIPIDSSGTIGKARIISTNEIRPLFKVKIEQDGEFQEKVKANIIYENNSDSDIPAIGMIAFFSETNEMLKLTPKSIFISKASNSMEPIESDKPEGANYARVFLWQGETALENDMISLVENLVIR